VKNVTEQLCAL